MSQIEVAVAYETAKLKRQLKIQGQQVDFARIPLNQYKTPDTTKAPQITSLNGIFHQSQSYVTIAATSDSASRVVKKQTPMFLGLWSELSVLMIDDEATISGTKYKVTDVLNVSNLSFAADVSLEVVK